MNTNNGDCIETDTDCGSVWVNVNGMFVPLTRKEAHRLASKLNRAADRIEREHHEAR